jgi:hypothetical protein
VVDSKGERTDIPSQPPALTATVSTLSLEGDTGTLKDLAALPNDAKMMFSNAIYAMVTAISVSISNGNHSASGTKPNAEAISETECATVNDVTMIMQL